MLGSIEVFNRECVNSDSVDSNSKANFKKLKRMKKAVVS